jgi:hypothetical protein
MSGPGTDDSPVGDGGGGASADDLPPPGGVLALDHVFAALAHPWRRYPCYTLLAREAWSLTDLAAKTAGLEVGDDGVVDEATRERVYVSLRHAHVPRLVAHGVVAFDAETERIARGVHAAQVFAVLEGLGASADARQEHHARERGDGDR